MSHILAIEASTQAGSVALSYADRVQSLYDDSPRNHTHTLLPFVDQLLQQEGVSLQQLDAIAFAQGPGSFTGLRLAVGLAQGLAYSARLPLIAVPTLEALAQAAVRQNIAVEGDVIVVCLDARMGEVYHAAFLVAQAGFQPLIQNELIMPEQWSAIDGRLVLVGDGVDLLSQSPHYEQVDIKYQQANHFPHAQDVLMLAQSLFKQGKLLQPHEAEPVYLRDSSAWQTLSQQEHHKMLKSKA